LVAPIVVAVKGNVSESTLDAVADGLRKLGYYKGK